MAGRSNVMYDKYDKIYKWKETWRDDKDFDWLYEIETCEEAIESLNIHIENSSPKHDFRSIERAESLILEIQDEIDSRKENPNWPTLDQVAKYCGKYPCGKRSGKYHHIDLREGSFNLTPELLATRWVSDVDFKRWLFGQYLCFDSDIVRIEPIPESLIYK